jgi:hypothetical protein
MPNKTETVTTNSTTSKKTMDTVGVYAAAGIGALFLGISDLLNHETGSTVEKIAEILQREEFFPDIQSPMWIALLLLVTLGVLASWVNRPKERIQGFMAGFSVFALLTVGVPQPDQPIIPQAIPETSAGGISQLRSTTPITTPPQSSLFSFFIPTAWAGELVEKSSVMILLRDENGKELKQTHTFMVTLINQDTKQKKRYRFTGTQFQIIDNFGSYKLYVEISGYRNAYTYFSINNKKQTAYSLKLESSALPVGLQKLLSAKKQDLLYSAVVTERLRGVRLFKMGEYQQAIQYYDKILRVDPNNSRIINYKGYSLYRWGKYEEAEKVLSQGIISDPHDVLMRLNLAKTYCKLGKNADASRVLFKELPLSDKQKQFVCNDGEFTNACSSLAENCR